MPFFMKIEKTEELIENCIIDSSRKRVFPKQLNLHLSLSQFVDLPLAISM